MVEVVEQEQHTFALARLDLYNPDPRDHAVD